MPDPAAGAPATVFLVDDDAAVRKGLARLLRSAGILAEDFASADAFLASGRHVAVPACLVLDVQMPGLSGPDLQQRLQALGVAIPVVFLTGHGDVATGVQAMKVGAVDFLEKPVDDERFLRAVAEALRRHVQDDVQRREVADVRARLEKLTPREREVLGLVVAGLLNKQIAAKLEASEKTIKVHRGRVMEKMEAASLAELVRMAGRVGMTGAPHATKV